VNQEFASTLDTIRARGLTAPELRAHAAKVLELNPNATPYAQLLHDEADCAEVIARMTPETVDCLDPRFALTLALEPEFYGKRLRSLTALGLPFYIQAHQYAPDGFRIVLSDDKGQQSVFNNLERAQDCLEFLASAPWEGGPELPRQHDHPLDLTALEELPAMVRGLEFENVEFTGLTLLPEDHEALERAYVRLGWKRVSA
jgi:hypothetical protein